MSIAFSSFDIDLIPQGTVADASVAKSGIKINSLPAGDYLTTVASCKVEQNLPDHAWDANRWMAKIKFQTEAGRFIFADVSWEPKEGDGSSDKAGELYSMIEQSLGMYGQDVRDVLAAMEGETFKLELLETARVMVGDLPEKVADYYRDTKGKGDLESVTVYIKTVDEDLRFSLAAKGSKLRNFIRTITKV